MQLRILLCSENDPSGILASVRDDPEIEFWLADSEPPAGEEP
jgi:hypothetical protein